MSEDQLVVEAHHLGRWQQHKFMVLVALTIVISIILTIVSLWLYRTSGAAQLDLSRPGYESVRERASQTDEITSFSASGPLDGQVLDDFRALYDDELKKITELDNFGSDVLSDATLGIDAPATE